MEFRILSLKRRIEPLRQSILNHELYPMMESMSEVRVFMTRLGFRPRTARRAA